MKSAGNYLYLYKTYIYPTLCNIDIHLKSLEDTTPSTAAALLDITEREVFDIAGNTPITLDVFLRLMEQGSSFICGLYRRELECGSPSIYTPSLVAYIYQIEKSLVETSCHTLGISQITPILLPYVLSKIELDS